MDLRLINVNVNAKRQTKKKYNNNNNITILYELYGITEQCDTMHNKKKPKL